MVELAGEGCGCDCWLLTNGTSLPLQWEKITKKNIYTKSYIFVCCIGDSICIGQEIQSLPYEEFF